MITLETFYQLADVPPPMESFNPQTEVEIYIEMYNQSDFWPTFSGGKPKEFVGPRREGQYWAKNPNPYNRSELYLWGRVPGGNWFGAYNLPINQHSSICCAMLVQGPQPSQLSMIYQGGEGSDLWVSYFENTSWSKPEKISVSTSQYIESNPHFELSNMTLYFGSNRKNNNIDIYEAPVHINGNRWAFGETKPVKGAINTSKEEDQAFLLNNRLCFSRSDTAGNLCTEWGPNGWSEGDIVNLCPPEKAYCAELSTLPSGDVCFAAGIPSEKRIKIMTAPINNTQLGHAVPLD